MDSEGGSEEGGSTEEEEGGRRAGGREKGREWSGLKTVAREEG